VRLRLTTTAALLAAATLPAGPAMAQACGDRGEIVAALAARWGESRQAIGVSEDRSSVIEVYAAPSTGTWTIVVSRTDGTACMVASGEGWQATPTPDSPAGEDG
jgi:hypothetical protein